MRYFYDSENDDYLTYDDMSRTFRELSACGVTEAETVEQYIRNCLDYCTIRVSEKVYTERKQADTVRDLISNHIASYHADWRLEITADGRAWGLVCEDEFICAIELDDVIPALDYLYSVIDMESTAEEDCEALDYMVSKWGL